MELLRSKNAAPSSASSSGRGTKRPVEDSSDAHTEGGLVVISSDIALPSVPSEVRYALQSAVDQELLAGGGVYSLEVLFLGVLRQRLLFAEQDLVKSSPTRAVPQGSAPPILEKKKPTAKSKKAK